MNSVLCSKNFREFFDGIETIGLPLFNLTELISSRIPVIADDLHLGRLVCEFNTPPSPIEPQGRAVESQMYISHSGFENVSVNYVNRTGDNGKVELIAYPVKGYTWSDDEKKDIEFLCRNIFLLCGRARLSDIVKVALTRDSATGILNTAGFVNGGNRLIAEGRIQEYAAMYLNLKNYRSINSQIGYKYGDMVMKSYADALVNMMDEDELVARLGGDNFAVMIKKEKMDSYLKFLSSTLVVAEIGGSVTTFNISARIGVYNIEKGDSMMHIMNCISSAISAVRRNGTSDYAFFNQEIVNKLDREQEISASFTTAIKNREFLVYYQPKVDLRTNRLCGCEALVRWQKDGKLISPGEFIPIFERDGNICALDFYMLDKVCRNISEWKQMGLEPVTVSVNFSKTHLLNPLIAEDIMAVINKYEVDTKYIEIELTEMSDFNDYNAFKALVNKMKANGVLTSIDDFGTGYSSLNLLTDFMFDVVKLDKSFLDNIVKSGSKTDEIVVRNIVRMIKELNMKAIAEGVESADQVRFLRDIECTMVQGYFYDKPLPVDEFLKRLKEKNYTKTA